MPPPANLRFRRADDRGHANHGWLDTRHSFSFAGYHDPQWMGFGPLRVINEDFIAGGAGFPMHPHRDMEIVTYVMEGVLEHKDSEGNHGLIHPGEVQRMTAGTGILHSEFNPQRHQRTHLLQIWILPDRNGYAPGYEQKAVPDAQKRGRWGRLASRDGREGSVRINQEAGLHAALLEKGERLSYSNPSDRRAWLHLARGTATLNGQPMASGDAALVEGPMALDLFTEGHAEFLLFDLP